jgi:hypothetical protein
MSEEDARPEPVEDEPQPTASAEDESLSAENVAELRRTTQVINQFYGNVDAASAQFGVTIGVSNRRATGPVDEAQVRQAHEHFIAPAQHDEAARVLVSEHVVVLAGPESTGRTTSAIVLLHLALDDPQAPLVSLSPATTLTKLAEYPHFKRDRGYLVRGWVDDAQPVAVQQFELARLAERLQENGTYLVLVTDSTRVRRQALGTRVIDWEPPTAEALFDEYAPPQPDPQARERVMELNEPAEVVTFAKDLACGLETALARLEGSAAKQVAEWFDSAPDRRRTLEVAALAFAHGLPDRTFETVFERLLKIANPVAVDVSTEPELRQSRAHRSNHPLVTTTRAIQGPSGLAGGRRLVFRSVEHRTHVITELVDRHGFELWDPIRTWLHELAAEPPLSELHFQIALGISLLARNSLHEVEQDYLHDWANGFAVMRLTAAHVLTWMCIDDSLAPQALRIALSWLRDAGPRRAMTAATALGSEIGNRYPADALRMLWYLASRSQRIGNVARVSLGLLFSSAVDNTEDIGWVLNVLRTLARRDIAEGNEYRRSRLARTALLAVLSGSCEGSNEPIIAHVLRRQPETVHAVGEIWCWVLLSGSHRGRAIKALREALRSLAERDGTRPVVEKLGKAIRERMPTPQLALLHRDLHFALGNSDFATAMLSALDIRAITA